MFLGDTMGGGVGLIDYDGDGWLDIYFVNGCPLPYDRKVPPRPNKLYRNRGDGTFEDVTARAGVGGLGYGMGCAVGDYRQRRPRRPVRHRAGRDVLYRNRGDGTFEDVTERAGVGSSLWTTAAGFGDLDGDGDLDLVAVTYVDADPAERPTRVVDAYGKPIHCPPGQFPPQPDLLFRNNGDGTFTDVSSEAGLDLPGGDGLGLAIADLDDDGKLDLFVANDAAPNFLFRNLGGLRFEEVGTTAGVAYDGSGRATASMGVVAEDLDGDGRIDLFHTNFINEPSTLLQQPRRRPVRRRDGPRRARLRPAGHRLRHRRARRRQRRPARPVRRQRPRRRPPLDQPPDGPAPAPLPGDARRAVRAGRRLGRPLLRPARPWAGARRPATWTTTAGSTWSSSTATSPWRLPQEHDARRPLARAPADRRPDSGKTPVGARVTCRAGGRTAVRWLTSGTSYLAANDPRLWFGLGSGPIDRPARGALALGPRSVVERPGGRPHPRAPARGTTRLRPPRRR